MPYLLHQLISERATQQPEAEALVHKDITLSYRELYERVQRCANGLQAESLQPGERVAIYLPKQPEAVFSIFAASAAGAVFVPINPLLKPVQVAYILKDCNVRVLITSSQRLKAMEAVLADCDNLKTVVVVEGEPPEISGLTAKKLLGWEGFTNNPYSEGRGGIDADMAAILYTSGSTGNPKGVVLSHRNMVAGAESVASYLKNSSEDRLLAILPFSFDYGLSQLTTAFLVGASVVLMDYLLPRDILRALDRYRITGLAAVPPIWNQLAQLEWSEAIASHLRYITNSGGAMPVAVTKKFRQVLPRTEIFLMYGLTEAFRSTYLPPDQVDIRPDSMGKAIPNAQVLVVREDGSECDPGEPGELVHRGALVSMGYWNDPGKTAERFKPAPGQSDGLPIPEMAVWSGDQVKKDDEGYLYFISRKDEMIKTSGYRVSPTEVEEVFYGHEHISEVAALGLTHPDLGQGILLVIRVKQTVDLKDVHKHGQSALPSFMAPHDIVLLEEDLPRNQNGKIDRKTLAMRFRDHFLSGQQ